MHTQAATLARIAKCLSHHIHRVSGHRRLFALTRFGGDHKELGIDRPRTHRRDPNAARPQLGSQRLRKIHDVGLGGGVHGKMGHRRKSGARRDLHNLTVCRHVRQHTLRQLGERPNIQVDHLQILFGRHAVERPHFAEAGIVHQPSHLRFYRIKRGQKRLHVGRRG